MRFWDSSALVPLLVVQPSSPEADRWLSQDPEVVVWTLTPIELASALMRLAREGALGEPDSVRAESRIDEIMQTCHSIVDLEGVKLQARRLLRVHALRAADALQLGAACEWAGGRPTGRVVHTFDGRLARAARREGFTVVPEPR